MTIEALIPSNFAEQQDVLAFPKPQPMQHQEDLARPIRLILRQSSNLAG